MKLKNLPYCILMFSLFGASSLNAEVLNHGVSKPSEFSYVNNIQAKVSGMATDAGMTSPKTAIVLNSGAASISLIDMETRKVKKTYSVGKEPHHLMLMPDKKSLLVANAAGNNVVIVDALSGEMIKKVSNIIDPYQIGYSPDKKWFVVAGNRLNRLDIYAADRQELQLLKTLKLSETPSHIAFSSDSKVAFLTLQDSDELAAIDLTTQTLLWKMPTGKTPAGIWMTPGDKYLLVGLTGSDAVQVIDWRLKKEIKQIKTGRGAHNFRPLGDQRHVFVTNRVDSTISLLDMQTLEKINDIKGLPSGPDCMDITPDGKELWVTFRFSKKVGVINIASLKLETIIPVGKSPHGVFFSPNAGWE